MRTNRRDMLKSLAALAACPAWATRLLAEVAAGKAGGAAVDHAAPADRPNIVFILADDLGYGDVHCLNPKRGKIPTPCIDKLAGQGMTFIDAHSASAVCTPTRYGVLTGRYPWRTRLQGGVLTGDAEPLIAADRLTVPALLKKSGYHSACVGKWHLGFRYDRSGGAAKDAPDAGAKKKKAGPPVGTKIIGGPTTRGFDTFFGFHHARDMHELYRDDRIAEHIDPIEMLPRLTRRAVEYIGERAPAAKRTGPDRTPFFLYLPLNSPHTPIVPTDEWKGKSGLNEYADFVMQTDATVGAVLAEIDRQGLTDNTLVIFASDNGCSPAAKIDALQAKGHYPSADLRGHKADIWDGGHRIPFLARWPGRIKPGSTSKQLICLNDLMATCAELLGATLPANAGEDSVSILPALLGRDNSPLREAVVHASINGRFAIRQGNWKLVLCAGSGGWSSPKDDQARAKGLPECQLYDVQTDLGEQKNLQAERPEVVARLTALLEKYVADGRSTPGPAQKNDAAVDIYKRPGTGGRKKKKQTS